MDSLSNADEIEEESRFISSLRQTWGDDEEQEDDETGAPAVKKLTKSPYMNELYALGTKLKEGKIDAETFRLKLDAEIIRFFEIYKNFLKVYYQTLTPDEINEQEERVFQCMEKYQKSLEETRGYFENGDNAVLDSGLNNAVDAINRLTEAYEGFLAKQSPDSSKQCPSCGHPNPMSTFYCNSCNSQFILSSDELPVEFTRLKWKSRGSKLFFGAAAIPLTLIEVYEGYGRYEDGAITKHKFVETLDWLITQFELGKSRLEREQYSAQQEAIESSWHLFDGMERAKKILEKLRDGVAFDQLNDPDFLWNGLLEAINIIKKSQ